MSVLTELFAKLETSLSDGKAEMEEFEGGKKAAALRLRKAAQESKKLWQEVRIATQAQFKAMPTKKREAK